jgi:hypothetical protein
MNHHIDTLPQSSQLPEAAQGRMKKIWSRGYLKA